MTIRFDDEAMELSLGVRDVAFVDQASGLERDLHLPLSRVSMGRVASGVHRERARIVARSGKSEIPITYGTSCLGYRVTIQGRIDILVDDEDELMVEEVKTLFRRGDHLPDSAEAADLENYRRQVLLYALFVQAEKGRDVRCRLALVSALDGTCAEIPIRYEREAVESFLATRLERIILEHQDARRVRDKKRAWVERLEFPFEVHRPYQDELMQSVTEALESRQPLLLSAPAGIGKTIGVLYPAIKHALLHGRRLIYVTAKNTQSHMVREMLERMGVADSPFRAVFLRSKEAMCATGELVCHEDACEFLRDFAWKSLTSGTVESLLQEGLILPERIYALAEPARLCPFYATMELTRRADLIVGDYNYVFDPIASLGHLFQDRSYEDLILIVDEAHNLPMRVMDAYSPVLPRSLLAAAYRDVEDVLNPLHQSLRDFIARVDAYIQSLRDELDPTKENCPFEPDVEHFLEFQEELEYILLRFLLSEERAPSKRGEDPVLNFFFTFAQFLKVLEMRDLPKVVYYRTQPEEELRILNLDPSSVIRDRVEGFHGTVLMSATLAPIEFYRRMLGLEHPDTLEIELPSPFPEENRAVRVHPGISTRYRDRERAYPRVAAIIQEVVRCRAGNYLCFFPSFHFLRSVGGLLDETRAKVIAQRPSMRLDSRMEILDELKNRRDGKTRIVLAVQGGIFAEGVDYPGDQCIGVIVVGPGLPAVSFENECIRQHFDQSDERGFEFAYLFPGMNRVIQSAGRLIRTPTDQGVLILVGQRFSTELYSRCFPADWYAQSPGELVTAGLTDDIEKFWEILPQRPTEKTFFGPGKNS